jgi:hypothetical protein
MVPPPQFVPGKEVGMELVKITVVVSSGRQPDCDHCGGPTGERQWHPYPLSGDVVLRAGVVPLLNSGTRLGYVQLRDKILEFAESLGD